MDRAPRIGPWRSPAFPVPQTFRLLNGVPVTFFQKRDLPLVQVSFSMNAGVSSDPVAAPGVAYVLSKMLTEGAGERDALAFSATLMDLGARLQSSADYDQSWVSLHILRPQLEQGLRLLGDALIRPRLAAKDFLRLRRELLGRALQREQDPKAVASLVLQSQLYGVHPYGRPILPLPAAQRTMTIAALRQFHRDHYHPGRLRVAVAGDASVDQLRDLLNRVVGQWASRKLSAAAPMSAPSSAPSSARGPRLVLVDRPGAAQAVLRVGHLGSHRRSPDYPALELLNVILGGGFTSRLNQNLREAHGYTYGASSSFTYPTQRGVFAVEASVETKHTVSALEQILVELRRIARDELSELELRKGREQIAQQLAARAETTRELASAAEEISLHGLAADSLARLPAQVASIGARELSGLAQRAILPDQATIVVVGDSKRLLNRLAHAYGIPSWCDSTGGRVSPRNR
jgi:predicted Zn-dependent peptidase